MALEHDKSKDGSHGPNAVNSLIHGYKKKKKKERKKERNVYYYELIF